MRWLVTPTLKRRLISINGGKSGYLHRFRSFLASLHAENEVPSMSFISQVVHQKKATPAWMVADFVRYAERKPDMPYEEAIAGASAWFILEGADSDE